MTDRAVPRQARDKETTMFNNRLLNKAYGQHQQRKLSLVEVVVLIALAVATVVALASFNPGPVVNSINPGGQTPAVGGTSGMQLPK